MSKDFTLAEIGETLEFIVKHMATKSDIEDLRRTMATKEELTEIKVDMARQDDVNAIRNELADIRRELKHLANCVDNIADLPKEIDHALDRIRRIERHLGIEATTAG